MTDDYAIADPAEETQTASGDMNLSQESGQEDSSSTPVYAAPVLDRIRTSD